MLTLALLYLVFINALAFAAFATDKRRAVLNQRRIPEATLLGLAFWGGSPGALAAQQMLRHKTRKEPFRTHLLLIVLLHTILGVAALVPEVRQFAAGLIAAP